VADTWTKLASTGIGPAGGWGPAMSYDAAKNTLITWSEGGAGELWQGALSATPATPNRYDLNSDGFVNVLDVQLAIRQAIGQQPCTTADFDGDGQCNNADIAMIVAAALAFGK
jgi:hypothetical protein